METKFERWLLPISLIKPAGPGAGLTTRPLGRSAAQSLFDLEESPAPYMNVIGYRGLALLAFFVGIVPLSQASTITQTFTYSQSNGFYGSAGGGGDGANIGAIWRPDAPTGLLESATLQVNIGAEASASNPNPYSQPLPWNVFLYWTPSLDLQLPNGSAHSAGATQSVYESRVLPPHESLFVHGLFSSTLSMTFQGSSLVEFNGSDPFVIYMRAGLVAGTQYGGGSHAATFNATLTYQTVADSGSTVPLLIVGLGGLLLMRRRHAVRRTF